MNICFKRCGTLCWLLNRKHRQASLYGLGALWLPFLERGCAEHIICLLCRVRLFKSNKILEFEEIPVCDVRPEALALPRSLTEMQTHESHQPTWMCISKGEHRKLLYEALPGDSNAYWSLRFLRHHRAPPNLHEVCRGTSAIFQGTIFFFFLRENFWVLSWYLCPWISLLILPVWSHTNKSSLFSLVEMWDSLYEG